MRAKPLSCVSVQDGELSQPACRAAKHSDRLAEWLKQSASRTPRNLLAPKIAGAQEQVVERRGEYLAKRVERRQAETLVRAAETEDAVVSERQAQQSLDNLFSERLVP